MCATPRSECFHPTAGRVREEAWVIARLILSIALLAAAGGPWGFAADTAGTHEVLATTTEAAAKVADDWGIVVVPIPLSNPTLGSGLTLASALLYTPGTGSHPWVTGVGAMYTDSEGW